MVGLASRQESSHFRCYCVTSSFVGEHVKEATVDKRRKMSTVSPSCSVRNGTEWALRLD